MQHVKSALCEKASDALKEWKADPLLKTKDGSGLLR